MEEQIELSEVLKAMREQIGVLAQENAILKATIEKLNKANDCRHCSDNSDNR